MSDQHSSGFPASLQQQRLFELAGAKSPGNYVLLRVQASLDAASTDAWMAAFVQDEENLHTHFVQHALSKYPLQHTGDDAQVMIQHHACPEEAEAKSLIAKFLQAPFEATVSESLRLDVFDWKGISCFVLVRSSRLFSDFQSLMNVARQFASFVHAGQSAAAKGEDELQYIDFSEWQHELVQDRAHQNALYWGKLGLNAEQFTTLHKCPANYTPSLEPGVKTAEATPEQLKTLQNFAESKGLTLQHVLLAAWWQLLKTYTVRPFSLAYQHDGRSEGQTELIFGLFEKYLPLPAEMVEGATSVWELAKKVRDTLQEQHLRHEHFHLGLDQKTGKGILFPYQFSTYKTPSFPQSVELAAFAIHADAFLLKLEVVESAANSELSLNLHYDPGFFSEAWMEVLAQQFCWQLDLAIALEQSGLEGWKSRKAELAMAFQQRIEGAKHAVNPAITLIDLLEQAVAQYPGQTAITYEKTSMTYQELHQISNRLARFIHEKTNGAIRSVVALQLDNPVHMVVSFLATLKSGNAFLPIEASNPPLRIKYLVENSRAILFFSDRAAAKNDFPNIHFNWEAIEKSLSLYADDMPRYPVHPTSDCYLIFTSGTTGNPKGVPITHGALVNYLTWFTSHFNITAEDNTVLFSSMAFDLGHTIIWSALTTGAHLHLVNPARHLEFLEHINAYLAEHHISYIKCTPSHFKLLLGDSDFARLASQQQLRLVVLGGEAIDGNDLARYFEHHCDTLIVDEYGPTETTIGVVAQEIRAADFEAYRQLPLIGTPFANHRIFILDDMLQPVLPGEYGGIYIAGPGLSKGYLNLPAQTEKAFIAAPFASDGNLRLYATGDLGRLLPDGTLQLAGRIDNQVKVRGYRIEPEEISQVIRSMDGVKAAFTAIHTSGKDDAGLRAFVVFEEAETGLARLKTWLADRLPTYMIPDQIFAVDTILLNANGKVDLEALNSLAEQQLQSETLQLPVEQDEIAVAQIWAELFEVPQIGLQQNFFQLGGHSLLAMKMLSRLQKQLGVRVPLADFFQLPTVQALVNLVRTSRREQAEAIQRITQQTGNGYYDLSLAQQRIWMQEQLKEKDGAFNIYFACRIKGDLDVATLEKHLNFLVQRHESFRTNFVRVEGQIKQQILEPEKATFRLDQSDQRLYKTEELEAVILEKCREGFNLESDALFRCLLLKTLDNGPILVFNFHHIIMDEWSMDLFIRELTDLLLRNAEADEKRFPALPIQYKDFAAWEQMQFSEDRLRQMQLFFRTQFAGDLPTLNLKTDFNRPGKRNFEGSNLAFEFTKAQHQAIVAYCQAQETSLFVFFLALTKVLMFRLTNQSDLIIGTLEANRNHPDLENVIGCFFNILPIRTRFKKEAAFADFMEQVKGQFNATLSYALYPFDYLLRDLKVQQKPGRSPVFDVMVTIKAGETAEVPAHEKSGIGVEAVELPALYSKYDLLFDYVQEDGSLKLLVEYDTNLFLPTTIREYFEVLQMILDSVLKDPSVPLNQTGSALQPASDKAEEAIETFFNF